jgi:MiaB-like tRNA modifying enzyme
MSNIYIESYGCSTSYGEAEMMAGLLKQANFNIVKNEKQADLIIVVTCYVKSPTEQKILFRIKNFQEKYPKKKLIIAGCMTEGIYHKITDIAPKASLVSTHHIKDTVQAVEKTLQDKKVEFLGKSNEIKLCLPRIRKNPIIDIVPISSGCNSNCTYCCVRIAKGKLFSYPKEMIIKEIETSLKEGCKEIWLTAQDTASYGFEKGEKLPELLKEITKIPEKFFLRVGMMNVRNVMPIANDLIESFKDNRIYKFIHLPIQSGSDKVLKSMNRLYTGNDFEKIINDFRKAFNCQVWTDVIMGYPTEEEEDFLKTLDVIKRIKPDWINVSKFGARPGTEAAMLKPLPPKVVNERSRTISEAVRTISFEKNKEWFDWKGEVLISEKGKKVGQWIGRNFAYKPILIEDKSNLLGKFLNVKVIDFIHSHLTGQINE